MFIMISMVQKAVYQVKKEYRWNEDGYTLPDTTIIATFASRKKAKSLLEKLVEENNVKKKAMDKAGQTGYYNIYNKYVYYINPIYLEG